MHAGWRGTRGGRGAGGGARAWSTSSARGPDDLRVALGPAIGVCCFEVGDEVVRRCRARDAAGDAPAAGAIHARGEPASAHVDLKRRTVCCWSAPACPVAIDAGPDCTSCDRARFFSYRRDGETGQLMGFVARAGQRT